MILYKIDAVACAAGVGAGVPAPYIFGGAKGWKEGGIRYLGLSFLLLRVHPAVHIRFILVQYGDEGTAGRANRYPAGGALHIW